MPIPYADFRDMVSGLPGLRTLRSTEQAKALYLRDRRVLPEELKRLFDGVSVVTLPMEEADDVSSAIGVATGEVASVSLGLKGDTLHYVRRSLEMMRDREVTVDWTPRVDPFDGEVLPQLDGFLLDLSSFDDVDVDKENGILRAGVGARWSDACDAARAAGWFLPLFATLPMDSFMGDIVRGETILSSYRGGPETCIRNVDFVGSDGGYGESGFDEVPNNATGYDLNSLLLLAGGSLTIPLSVTFSLMPSAEDLRSLTYILKDWEEVGTTLQKIPGVGVHPLAVFFGDTTSSRDAPERKGENVTVFLHGTEETFGAQVRAVDTAFGEGFLREDGVYGQTSGVTREPRMTPLAEIRLSTADLPPLLADLASWQEVRGPAVGLAGSLHEGGTVSLIPFVTERAGRGERFDRAVELLEIAGKHPCRLRSSQLIHLLDPDADAERRFGLVRQIKARVDLPLVINPSRLLWVPRG